MKIAFLSFFSLIKTFILFSVVSTNLTHQSQTIDPGSLIKNSLNYKSHFSEKDFEEALKTMNKSKQSSIKKEKLLTSTTLYEDEHAVKFQNFSTVKSLFHIFQIKPERLKTPSLNKINEKSLYPNQPLFHKIYILPRSVDYTPEKRGLYFGTFLPMLYHHNHFQDVRSFYHPYFHKNYDLRNVNKRFTNQRQHMDNYAVGNHVYYPDKRFTPYNPQDNILLSKSHPSFLLQLTTDNTMRPYTILNEGEAKEKSTFLDISNKKSSNKLENMNTSADKVENIYEYLQTEILTELPAKNVATDGISLFKPDQNEPVLNRKNQQKLDEERFLNGADDEALVNIGTKDSNDTIKIHGTQERFEPIYNKNNSKSNNSNLLASNRLFYEKIPSNLNVSWFVYVSCSRERCQFTNSTNETELMNEGWILHNCTNYGCSEMYPETETMQKFIGLMLLVFSICILKIVAFLLVFYYCRRIKLTKIESEERERLILKEDEPDFPFKEKKSYREGTGREMASTDQQKHAGDPERNDTQLKRDVRDIQLDKSRQSNLGPYPRELSKINSKIWIPPVQTASPCLVTAAQAEAGDVLIPNKCSEKTTTTVKSNANLQKSGRKCINSSPKLENWLKDNTSDTRKETNNSEQTYAINLPNIKEQSTEDGELLLMDLEEEICTGSSRSPSYSGKASSWEILLEKECKGFINIDVSDEENSGN